MTKKLLIIPWFGKYPEWLDQWVANMQCLKKYGYDYLIDSNITMFRERVRDTLRIEPNIQPETGKPWDYRPMLATLYANEIKGYDYWGHTDFDVVYGDVSKYEPKEDFDIWSNHHNYICGFWTLYKNIGRVNNIYLNCPTWKERVLDERANGWAEMDFTRTVDQYHNAGIINRIYTFYQPRSQDDDSPINYKDGRLYDGEDEIMSFHFRHTKRYPIDRYII